MEFKFSNIITGLRGELYKISIWVYHNKQVCESGDSVYTGKYKKKSDRIIKYNAGNYLIKNEDIYIEYMTNFYMDTIETTRVKKDLILNYNTNYNTFNGINL